MRRFGHMETAQVPLPPLAIEFEPESKRPVSHPMRTIVGLWWIRDEVLPLGQPEESV